MPAETHHQADPIHAPARQAQDQAHRTGPTIDLALTWAGALPMLLAVLRDGVPEGQRQAEAELLRMARVADLASGASAMADDQDEDEDAEPEPMDAAQRHQAEQDEITEAWEQAQIERGTDAEEFEIVSRVAPAWAWEIIDETLSMDAMSKAFDPGLRESIRKAHAAVILASELADDEPMSDTDPRLDAEP